MVFQTHARVERYETSDKYFAYKMEENSSPGEHVLRMSKYYNRLNQVGVNLPDSRTKTKHGDDGMRKGIKNGVTSDDFRTLKPP